MAIIDGSFWLNKTGKPIHSGNIPDTEKIKDELVESLCEKAADASKTLFDFKKSAFDEVESYFELLLQEYKVDEKSKSKKGNFTLENYSGTAMVKISVADRIAFDEKLSIAKIKIDEFLHAETEGASPAIQTLITKAFEVDKKGDVNAKKILSLLSYEIDDERWKEAMQIVKEATEIISSKNYIRFYTRESTDKEYKQIPLNISKD